MSRFMNGYYLNEYKLGKPSSDFVEETTICENVSKGYFNTKVSFIKQKPSRLFKDTLSDISNPIVLKIKKEASPLHKNISYIISKFEIRRSLNICGEEFYIEEESNMIIITHPVWSLIGQGDTLYEAIKNLNDLSFEVFISLADEKPSDLTNEANKLRDYLFKVF